MTISSASSHQKSSWWSSTPRLAPQDETNATVMARPISNIIPGVRERISLIAPVRNGRPPQKYMTVPSTGETHCDARELRHGVAEDHREHAREAPPSGRPARHDPEQPAELRDVVLMPAVARRGRACDVVGVSLVLSSARPRSCRHRYPMGVYRDGASRSR